LCEVGTRSKKGQLSLNIQQPSGITALLIQVTNYARMYRKVGEHLVYGKDVGCLQYSWRNFSGVVLLINWGTNYWSLGLTKNVLSNKVNY